MSTNGHPAVGRLHQRVRGVMRCTESFRSENADLRAASAAVAFDTDLRRNLRADLFGVAHHTHLASLSGFEGREGGEHEIERFFVEVAKSFIDEETADVEGAARERSQAQCEREGDNEGLAAREGVDKSVLVEHIVVDDFEGEGAFEDIELIARGESAEVMVGVLNEEGEGEGLCQIAESFAVGRAEQFVESAPLFGVVARLVDFLIVVFGFAQALFVSLYAASLFAHGFALAIQFVVELRALCHEDIEVHFHGIAVGRFVVDAGSLRFKFEIALLGALSVLLGDEFRFAALVEESAEGFPVARVGKDFAQLGHLQRRVVAVELRDGDIEFEGHGTTVFVVANGFVALVFLLSLKEMEVRLCLSVSRLCRFEESGLLLDALL